MAINRQIITTHNHNHYIPRYTSSYSWKSTLTSTTTISENGNTTTTSNATTTTTIPTNTTAIISDSKTSKVLPIHYNYNDAYDFQAINKTKKTIISTTRITIPIDKEPKFVPIQIELPKKPDYNKNEHFKPAIDVSAANRSVYFDGSNFGILGKCYILYV